MSNSVNKDLRKKTNAELAELVVKCKEQLLQIRFNVANGESEKLHTVNGIRKVIARSFTILNERSAQVKNSEQNSQTTKTKKVKTGDK